MTVIAIGHDRDLRERYYPARNASEQDLVKDHPLFMGKRLNESPGHTDRKRTNERTNERRRRGREKERKLKEPFPFRLLWSIFIPAERSQADVCVSGYGLFCPTISNNLCERTSTG
ncbi:uncharacterized protein LOC122534192 isoform X1 [Frieseomelitta varia]|uniref:uncharacterized protein LOC122534192 isoform X1 n=1 Tax=Frieseomelitta varia TaxID=561572 RepID=UPI001CB67BAC|nr:uncharacterized protein LOC122534192 isoform X1 [Frieseomelitta varia]